MNSTLAFILVVTILDGLVGLAGGLIPSRFVRKHLNPLVAFAAGTLLGVAFFELIPEAFDKASSIREVMAWLVAGFVLFHIVEQLFEAHAESGTGHRHRMIGPFILTGDALHNVTDGVAIAAAFLVDVRVGIATSLAVILHEIPHEMGDYAILIGQGYPKRKSLVLLFIVQLTAVLGALATYAASKLVIGSLPAFLGITAGGFIYIGAADLLPELRIQHAMGHSHEDPLQTHAHRHDHPARAGLLVGSVSFIVGLAVAALLAFME